MRKTYIPTFLRLVRQLVVYLRDHQRTMIDAGGLTAEQQQALTALVAALHDVERLVKSSTVPHMSREPGAARKPRPRRFTEADIERIYREQDGRCYYCGKRLEREWGGRRVQIDHAQPRSRGGTHAPDNIRLACVICNRHKGMLTEAEFLAALAVRNGSVVTNNT